MGRDKLIAPFAGVPLARRVVLALLDLAPLVVAPPAVAAVLADLHGFRIIPTPRTDGPSVTLALADAQVPADLALAVVACDLPFLDAARVRAFLARVPANADIAYPAVGGMPGHPVVWSPKARTRIAALSPEAAPMSVRSDRALRVLALDAGDDAYVTDVDTPETWRAAERRAAGGEGH